MKNIFDLEIQNNSLDSKIVAGFDCLSQIFKVMAGCTAVYGFRTEKWHKAGLSRS